MGPPGAGKGTQARLLAEKIGYHQFSTGAAFRTLAGRDTKLGRRVREAIDNGYLASPKMAADIVIAAVKEHIERGERLVFDGTPRTSREALLVDEFFAQRGYGQPLVIYLDADKEEMIRRNARRRFCLGIEKDFPVLAEEDRLRCERLGGRVGVRPDDTPEKYETRWSQFLGHTWPVVEKYRQEGISYEVDGMGSIEEVHKRVMGVISTVSRGK